MNGKDMMMLSCVNRTFLAYELAVNRGLHSEVVVLSKDIIRMMSYPRMAEMLNLRDASGFIRSVEACLMWTMAMM